MILIGSSAIKHLFPDFNREPKDIDYIVNIDSKLKSENGIEYLQNPIIYNKYKPFTNTVISKDDLVTLKASHLFWNINWQKHMFDLQFLLNKGCKIDSILFNNLYDYWQTFHGKNKRSDLKMTKEDFFTNKINYDTAQHDDLHLIINPTPIYSTILEDGKEVELSEEKYNQLTHEQKIELIREEVMVMAYERFKDLDYKIAYSRMLKKFIISHAPKFTMIFILENYIELHKPKFNYIKKIEDGINKH
jgi:hypothetical protein